MYSDKFGIKGKGQHITHSKLHHHADTSSCALCGWCMNEQDDKDEGGRGEHRSGLQNNERDPEVTVAIARLHRGSFPTKRPEPVSNGKRP